MARFAMCPNCSARSTDRSGSPINIFRCRGCKTQFCGYCKGGKSGIVVRTFTCPTCGSAKTSRVGQTTG